MKKQQKTQTQAGSSYNSPKFHMHEVLAKFSPELTRNEQAKLISFGVIQILSDPNWFIRQNYHDQQWKQIFPYILQSFCRRFFLMNTGLSQIVLEISKIKFSCLKQIDLSSNKISNVESILFLRIPNIKTVILKNNCIVNINTLRKGKWKNLQHLDLQGNVLIRWDRLSQLYINSQIIQSFSIQFTNSQNVINLDDISHFYAKLAWNKQNNQIIDKINYFNNAQNNTLHQIISTQIIKLGSKKSEALKRKFCLNN